MRFSSVDRGSGEQHPQRVPRSNQPRQALRPAEMRQRSAGELGLDSQCHQLLLGTVVQVALNPSALGIPRLDDAGPRGLQFRGALSKFLQRGFQRGIQL